MARAPSSRGSRAVGAVGFEPTTFRPPAECATRLRHAPHVRTAFSLAALSGRRGSNPCRELGRLQCYRYTTPAWTRPIIGGARRRSAAAEAEIGSVDAAIRMWM